jgi:CTP synthase (UTP-ammonia lyase)
MDKRLRVGIVGDYDPDYISHDATGRALEAAGGRLGADVHYEWIATDAAGSSRLYDFDGLWAAPGSPYRSLEGALEAIRFARESNRPFLGT